MQSDTILIVGAGPVGLTLACLLAQKGVPCRVVDRSLQPAQDSRATDIHARTLEVFRGLGIADEVIARGKVVQRFRAYSDGRQIVTLSLAGLPTPHPFAIALPQADTEAILARRLQELGGTVERGVHATDIRPGEHGVNLTLRHPGGREERVRAAWLIGCDGSRSDVRSAAGIAFQGFNYRDRYLAVDGELDWDLAHDEVHIFATKGGFINVLALPDSPRKVRVLANLDGPITGPHLEVMQQLMRERMHVPATLRDATFSSTFTISQRLASTYRKGHILLAGDAAHLCSPLLGQGMNTGIQDVHNLAWKLALVASRSAGPALLDSYTAERRAVARSVLLNTHVMHKSVTVGGSVSSAVRDLAFGWAHGLPGLRGLAVTSCSELGAHYHGSPIVGGDRKRWKLPFQVPSVLQLRELATGADTIPAPGDRAPNLPLPGSTDETVHDLVGQRHTLLVFEGTWRPRRRLRRRRPVAAEELARRIAARYGSLVEVVRVSPAPTLGDEGGRTLRDETGALHRGFHAQEGALCLLRPDSHIGFRAARHHDGQLLAHLETVFQSESRRGWREESQRVPRMQLFEFNDQPWLPSVLRDGLTSYLETLSRTMRFDERMTPVVEEALERSGSDRIVDLCSGGGGPMVQIRERMPNPVPLLLTDKFPNESALAAASDRGVAVHPHPVDATAVPPGLRGTRTIINALHHFPPDVARQVLADAAAKDEAIVIIELSGRTEFNVLASPFIAPSTLLFMPLVRPIRWEFLLTTYVLPILPLMIAWDGLVSNLRTYTVDELHELTAGLGGDGYTWEIDRVPVGASVQATVLVGIPGRARRSAAA